MWDGGQKNTGMCAAQILLCREILYKLAQKEIEPNYRLLIDLGYSELMSARIMYIYRNPDFTGYSYFE